METHEVVRAIAQAVGISAPMIAARMNWNAQGCVNSTVRSKRPDMVTVLGDLIAEKMPGPRAVGWHRMSWRRR